MPKEEFDIFEVGAWEAGHHKPTGKIVVVFRYNDREPIAFGCDPDIAEELGTIQPRRFATRCVVELRQMCARRVLRAGLGVEVVKGPARRKRPQRDLFVDPMPDRIEPCLAQLHSEPPAGDDWAFEVKWDGYRLAIHIVGKRVRIITRGGFDWTPRFPTIAHDALQLGLDSAILDGEAVVLDKRGAADFGALQKALGGRGGKRFASEASL